MLSRTDAYPADGGRAGACGSEHQRRFHSHNSHTPTGHLLGAGLGPRLIGACNSRNIPEDPQGAGGLGYSERSEDATGVRDLNRSRRTARGCCASSDHLAGARGQLRRFGHVAGLRYRAVPARPFRPRTGRPRPRSLEHQDPPLPDDAASCCAGRRPRGRTRPYVQPALLRLRPEETRRGAVPLHPRQSRRDLRLLPAVHGPVGHRRA